MESDIVRHLFDLYLSLLVEPVFDDEYLRADFFIALKAFFSVR